MQILVEHSKKSRSSMTRSQIPSVKPAQMSTPCEMVALETKKAMGTESKVPTVESGLTEKASSVLTETSEDQSLASTSTGILSQMANTTALEDLRPLDLEPSTDLEILDRQERRAASLEGAIVWSDADFDVVYGEQIGAWT
jgi:formylmethanofuran dehydrogenase subunit A